MPGGERNRINLKRGLFRLWLTASILWVLVVASWISWPKDDEYCRQNSDTIGCIAFVYRVMTPATIPVFLPDNATNGIPYSSLTELQQRAAVRLRLGDAPPPPPRKSEKGECDHKSGKELWECLLRLLEADRQPSRLRH